jgi:hypothetical protein
MSIASYYKNIDKHAYHLFFKYWLSITKKIYFKKFILNWDYFLSINPNITWDIVKELQKSSSNGNGETISIRWDYCLLSSNPNITWDIVTAHPYPSSNANVAVSNIISNNWCYNRLSGNPNITWDIVSSHPEKSWDYDVLSSNPNITWDIVRNNPIPKAGKKWCYSRLSINPNITWEIVKENPYPNGKYNSNTWNYHILSKNSSITWDIVKENPDKFKNYYFLSQNPNITWNIFLENLYPHGDRLSGWDQRSTVLPVNTKCEYTTNDWDYSTLLSSIDFIDKVVVEKIKNIISHFKTNITEELMMYVWHPSRVEKWKYLLDDGEI